MRVSISGYILLFHVSVAAFTTEPEHFFTCFQQISVSGITVSSIINMCLCCRNAKFRTNYFVPSSAGEFNATVDVTLLKIFFVAEVVQKLG